MDLKLRTETVHDYAEVEALVKSAFASEKFSDQTEHQLVARLRKSTAFIPQLSIVAEASSKIVGHILLTRIQIKSATEVFPSLALAPVSVLPAMQKKGIGAQLIKYAHKIAHDLGHTSIILLGHEKYYPKFGYKPAHTFGIKLPFKAPEENCMAIELITSGLNRVTGEVCYPDAFFK